MRFKAAIIKRLTEIIQYDIMKKLDERVNTISIEFEPSEGERTLLSSNKGGMRSPSLDLGLTPDSSEDELIKILAQILVEGFLWQHKHGTNNTTQGSDLLPSINKRTS
jgi:hypothetical protein